MSQRKTRGNPNVGRRANAPTPIINISTPLVNNPTMAANISNLVATTALALVSSNPEATLPTAPANVAIPRRSNLLTAPMEVAEREHFGKDKDLKTLLKYIQPKAFKGEGIDIPKILEEWIISIDDYFALPNYNSIAQGIMGRAKLEGSAKLW